MSNESGFLYTATVSTAALAGTLFGGCTLFRDHVHDLTFVSVERIAGAPHELEPRTQVRVHFSTATDLSTDKYGAYGYANLCPPTDDNEVSLDTLNFLGQTTRKDDDPLFEYSADIYYEYVWHFDEEQHAMVHSPLPAEVSDLCFQIRGAQYMGMGGLDSNIIVIPKGALLRALGGAAEPKS